MNITTQLYDVAKRIIGISEIQKNPILTKVGVGVMSELRDAITAYESQQHPAADFADAVSEACAVCWVDFDASDPRKTVRELIAWNEQVALDPRVSSAAQALIERGRNEARQPVDERAEFEKWMTEKHPRVPLTPYGSLYVDERAQAAHVAWQARAALSPAVTTVAESDRAALVRHAIKLMQQKTPWDGKTFDPELHHTLQQLADAPPSGDAPKVVTPHGWLIPKTRHYLSDEDKQNAIQSGSARQRAQAEAFSFAVYAAPPADAQPHYRHRKRGTLYREIARGQLQTAADIGDGSAVVIYVGADGQHWVRPVAEFDDGRFERVANGVAAADARDAEDARRYRWLRQWRAIHTDALPSLPWVVRLVRDSCAPAMQPCSELELDQAIDRAMGGNQ